VIALAGQAAEAGLALPALVLTENDAVVLVLFNYLLIDETFSDPKSSFQKFSNVIFRSYLSVQWCSVCETTKDQNDFQAPKFSKTDPQNRIYLY